MLDVKAASGLHHLLTGTDVVLEGVRAVKFQFNKTDKDGEVAILIYTGDTGKAPIYRIGFSFDDLNVTLGKYDPKTATWLGNLKVIS